MKKLFIFIFLLILTACNKPKVVLICGDHVCINNSEAEQFFEENLTLEVRLIDKKKSYEKLEIVQQKLFDNQTKMNKSLENEILNVLVENRTDDKSKLFGKSEHMTSVFFNGNDDLIGKVVKIKIKNSNRNTLFGEVLSQSNQKVA